MTEELDKATEVEAGALRRWRLFALWLDPWQVKWSMRVVKHAWLGPCARALPSERMFRDMFGGRYRDIT